MAVLLALPAIVVTACFAVIWFGIEDAPGVSSGGIDWTGLALITAALGLVMGGLIALRLSGPESALPWLLIVAGLAALVPFARYENAQAEPLIDVRLLAQPGQWPVQVTAFLFGMSVLGAQIPLSTFARTDPDVAGFGLGADASFVSTLIGVYVVFLAIGALTLPLTSRLLGPRAALVVAALLVAVGYGLWLPFHDSTSQALLNMAVVGVGSGALVAALPPRGRRRCTARPDRLRDRHDQRDQDRRRGVRVVDLRHRARVHRVDRGHHREGPRVPGWLPHRLDRVRGRGPPRRWCAGAAAPENAETAVETVEAG